MAILTFRAEDGMLIIADVDHMCAAEEDRLLGMCAKGARAGLAVRIIQLKAAERRYAAAATPQQWAIGWTGYVKVRMAALRRSVGRANARYAMAPPEAMPRAIYGELMPQAQITARADHGDISAAEALGVSEVLAPWGFRPDAEDVIRSAHAAGWRYGTWFSEVDPDGDLGQHHVAHLDSISRAQFFAARRDGWPA